MDEYVSKEAFIKRFEGMNMSWVLTMLDIFKEFPAADVEPVRHARWTTTETILGRCCVCSACGSCPTLEYRFCPYCGAKMDLEVSDV